MQGSSKTSTVTEVALDLDGLVADFATSANIAMASRLGLDPLPIDHYHWWHDYGELAEWAWEDLWAEIGEGGWFNRLAAYPGAVDAIWNLAATLDNVSLTFVTNRPAQFRYETREWLDRHGLSLFECVHATNKAQTGHDLYVDDNTDVLSFIPSERGLVWHRPWNAGWTNHKRVHTWWEVKDVVRDLGPDE